MIQEQTTEKTVALSMNGTKLTVKLLLSAIKKYLEHHKNKPIKGKQTLKQLVKKNTSLSNIEITENNIKSFEGIAKKYGIDFAVKRDSTEIPPRYLVFFKGRDVDVINQAFKEFIHKQLHSKSKQSILQQLSQAKEALKKLVGKEKVKFKDRSMEL